jgi:hypothetical protein
VKLLLWAVRSRDDAVREDDHPIGAQRIPVRVPKDAVRVPGVDPAARAAKGVIVIKGLNQHDVTPWLERVFQPKQSPVRGHG